MPYPKFSGIDFSKHAVIEYDPDQLDIGAGFRCGRGEFVSYIKGQKIRNELRSYISKCWLVNCEEGLAAYITLLADKLAMGTPILVDEDVRYTTFPAVKIGWLAADPRAKGSGRRLMDWAMRYAVLELVPKLGVRFITVDALYDAESPEKLYDASGFYEKLGFRFANADETLPPADGFRSMYFDLMPLIQQVKTLSN
ncbi:hypothetical protein SAMN04487996_12189 [Dyadobacter soli]|uniref:Acetyltransferase (GNAT) family protein n=1 Tax=Dyadobacter soli TaxID=659014 RepID=A0A1G7W239_9BACT|nr:GNAT family N-acetyltransferase [Dyadobacter soli]SDG66105.1 hypothetical protein SAMN04487996_12189 [Dyadobacter soli]